MNSLSFTPREIVKATGGVLLAGPQTGLFSDVSIDSRKIHAHSLFVAIKGQNHDGHDFIEAVLEKGVKGVVVCAREFNTGRIFKKAPDSLVIIGVDDTVVALGDLARFHRCHFDVPVTAITGSNGKTSTKEMIASVLGRRFSVLSTAGNFNNDIGLPLTLFQLSSAHEQVVLELGMNHPGEILRLGRICLPDMGVITNIGPSHLAGMGSIEAVKQGKGELLQTISPQGKAVLNADDSHVMDLAEKTDLAVLTFGVHSKARVRGTGIVAQGAVVRFTLVLPEETCEVNLSVPGKFMVSNALAAAAVGYASGLTIANIKAGLEMFRPVKGRMNVLESFKGFHIVDDTYNANPSSVKAAIGALIDLKGCHRGAVCLGDMLELGNTAATLHREIGRVVGHAPVSRLFVTGVYAGDVARGAVEAGMIPKNIITGAQDEIGEQITDWIKAGDWILVKGSRSTRMENIVNRLMEKNGDADGIHHS